MRLHPSMPLILSCAFPLAVWAQTCAPPPSEKINWWPLDETAGTTANDLVGGKPGAHVNGPAPAAGQVGGGLRFDGGNDYVGTTDSDLWDFADRDFSIELWANFDAPGGGTVGHPGDIFIGHDEGPGNMNKWFFALGGGFLNFHINSPTIGPKFFPLVPFSPTPGQWYHLAVTRRGHIYTIYIDGAPGGVAINTDSIPNANAPLTIGQAESLGFMSGRLDEIAIYHRALSQAELQAIFTAGAGGQCKVLQISTRTLPPAQLGKPYTFNLSAMFAKGPLTWGAVGGTLPAGLILTSAGLIGGTPTQAGSHSVTISVTDGSATSLKSFLFEVLLVPPPRNLRISKAGTLAVPGRVMDYFLVVENLGTSIAIDTNVSELLAPDFTFLSAAPPPAVLAPLAMAWVIPSILPGAVSILSYKVQLNALTPLGGLTGGSACTNIDSATLNSCLTKAAFNVAGTCFGAFLACACAATSCPTGILTIPCLGCAAGCVAALNACGNSPDAAEACLQEASNDCGSHRQTVVGAIDPNEKGVVASRYIQPDQRLVYPVHFENVGTAEARDVFITDILDPNLDLSTLALVTPAGASVDEPSRTIRWNLLNRNLLPKETDNVLASIKPKPGLPSGTVIRNKATIQFEVFQPFTTNEVVNIIDTTKPACVVSPLPAQLHTTAVPLKWTGSDAIGEIDFYTVLVSTDGGAFTPLSDRTQSTAHTFNGVTGKTYRFLCVATDTAGNVEVQPDSPEATTRIVLAGDVNADGVVNCADLSVVRASFGRRTSQPGFDSRADVNNDGVVDIRDLSFVSQKLPAGTQCL